MWPSLILVSRQKTVVLVSKRLGLVLWSWFYGLNMILVLRCWFYGLGVEILDTFTSLCLYSPCVDRDWTAWLQWCWWQQQTDMDPSFQLPITITSHIISWFSEPHNNIVHQHMHISWFSEPLNNIVHHQHTHTSAGSLNHTAATTTTTISSGYRGSSKWTCASCWSRFSSQIRCCSCHQTSRKCRKWLKLLCVWHDTNYLT